MKENKFQFYSQTISKAPANHSKMKPMVKIIKNRRTIQKTIKEFKLNIVVANGKRKISSRSKIKYNKPIT